MERLVQISGGATNESLVTCLPKQPRARVFWLQGVTLGWMSIEFGVAIYAAAKAHSPALLAFGSDSIVELMSAVVVLLQWIPRISMSERKAARTASVLLFILAPVVSTAAIASLAIGLRPEPSGAGIAITIAALFAMPMLAWVKRHEAHHSGNIALAADAAQSATCGYLALVTLIGLAINAFLDVSWFDAAAALAAVPILFIEGRSAWHGHTCNCR